MLAVLKLAKSGITTRLLKWEETKTDSEEEKEEKGSMAKPHTLIFGSPNCLIALLLISLISFILM